MLYSIVGQPSLGCNVLGTRRERKANLKPSQSVFIPGVPEVNCTPPPPVTNYSHPRCYARASNNCGHTISKEHYISQQVLELWAEDGVISTNMLGSFAGELSRLKLGDLGANILCKRHNEALSGLDDVGGTFGRFIRNVTPQLHDAVINGSDLERWFLKIFLGHSVLFYKQQRSIKSWQPSMALLKTLFDKRPLEKDCGLYGFSVQNVRRPGSGIALNYVSDKITLDGIGILFVIEGVPMLFGINPPTIPPNPHIEAHHHPACFSITENHATRKLFTGWMGTGLIFQKDP